MSKRPTDASLVDARGMRCPWPVLRAAKALRSVSAVVVVTDDPMAAAELGAFALAQGLSLTRCETGIGPGFHLAPERSDRG